MEQHIEQRVCLKFCLANGISCAEALKMLHKAYGKSVISKTRAFQWYKAFKEGREIVENLPHTGRPATAVNAENIDLVKRMLLENPHCSLRELSQVLSMSHESVRQIYALIKGAEQIQEVETTPNGDKSIVEVENASQMEPSSEGKHKTIKRRSKLPTIKIVPKKIKSSKTKNLQK